MIPYGLHQTKFVCLDKYLSKSKCQTLSGSVLYWLHNFTLLPLTYTCPFFFSVNILQIQFFFFFPLKIFIKKKKKMKGRRKVRRALHQNRMLDARNAFPGKWEFLMERQFREISISQKKALRIRLKKNPNIQVSQKPKRGKWTFTDHDLQFDQTLSRLFLLFSFSEFLNTLYIIYIYIFIYV